jgi:hypothetical protein
VLRGGYGRFYDKSHFELIGGLYTATPFTTSFTFTSPVAAADAGPRNGQFPTDQYLVNGPVINRPALDALFPPGSTIRNTGASWDNADRSRAVHGSGDGGLRAAAGREHGDQRRLRARVQPRPADVPGPQCRTANRHGVHRSAAAHLPAAGARAGVHGAAPEVPGFANFTTGVTSR